MMEAICLSETSVDFQGTARRFIPEDRTLCNREVLGSNLGWVTSSTNKMALILLVYPRECRASFASFQTKTSKPPDILLLPSV
jgi:hypothetical protein